MESSLKSQTSRALKWSALSTIASGVLQVGSTVVLGRLIGPSEYGLLAMANVFIAFGGYLSQMGLGPALIQKPEIDAQDIRASFTLAFFLGMLLTIITILFSPMIGRYYRNQTIPAVVSWLGVTFFLSGLSLTSISLLRRQLNFKATAWIETGAFILGNGLIAIPCAVLGFGVWSLVASILAQRGFTALFGFIIVRHSVRPIFSFQAYRKCLRFGTHYSANTVLDFFYSNIEALLIGRLYSEKIIGLYNRSQLLISLPMEYSVSNIAKVFFPVFTKLQHNRAKLKEVFRTVFLLTGLICGAVSMGMFPAAREIILVILGRKWAEAVIPFQFLVIILPLEYLMSTEAIIFDSLGKLGARSKIRGLGILLKLIAVFIGYRFGFEGFLTAVLIASIGQQVMYLPFIQTHIGLSILEFLFIFSVIGLNAGFIGGIIWLITFLCRCAGFPLLLTLAIQIILGTGIFLTIFLFILRYSLFGIPKDTFYMFPFLGRFWKK